VILARFFLTVSSPDLVTMFSPGPVDMIISFVSERLATKVTTRDGFIGEKLFEIDLRSNKDYNVITASDEHLTKDGELIVWKGIRLEDSTVGIVQLIIPKNAWVMPNTEGSKFRTNHCRVENIYKVNIYECYTCKNCGVYDYEGILYCSGCAALIIKKHKESRSSEAKLRLFDIAGSEKRDIGYSALRPGFKYRVGQEIKIPEFIMELSNCDKAGIYFFFRLEQVFNYMFKPTMKQEVKVNEAEISPDEKSENVDDIRINSLRLRKSKCVIQ